MTDKNRRYHDRIAGRYDAIYEGDPYWDFYFEVSWRDLKRSLPTDLSPEVIDVGCGTGRYGLKLLDSGFKVVFSDLSPKMVDQAVRLASERAPSERFRGVPADITDLAPFADESFSFLTAQGDPLSFSSDWRRALRSIRRVLRPGARAVVSVDNRFGAIDPFLSRGDAAGLQRFLEDGAGEWLAKKADERFPFHAFTPDELRRGAHAAGLRCLGIIGKTCLDLRGDHPWLQDRELRRELLEFEAAYGATELGLGRAHHLQATFERPLEDALGQDPVDPAAGAGPAPRGHRPPRRRRR